MNDLQLTLLIFGGGGIATMIAYNWWQDYRLRKQATERFGETDEDPLLNAAGTSKPVSERSEPGFIPETEHPQALDVQPESNANQDFLFDDNADDTELNDVQDSIDKRLFAEFLIRFDSPKDANTWDNFVDGFDHINRKRVVHSVCPTLDETGDVLWFKASPYLGTARALKVSLQIANRKGPLTSIEFSEVLGKLKHFAEAQNADIDFPEMKDVMAKAETLDQAAAALDTLLGLHCLLPETVPEGTIANLLADAGWQQKGHQWFLSDDSGTLASMVIHNAPGKRLLSFSIDVPNSAEPVNALGDIVTVCHGMNERFGAPLMDDSGRTLSTQAIEGIYNQLMERVRDLSDSGFKPGSPVARTLFS